MERKDLQAEQGYHEAKTDTYFWTPDGVGGYWYDTLEEMEDQHGAGDVIDVDEILDY